MNPPEPGKEGYREALDYLYSLQKYGIKLGLENTRRLLAALGDPHRVFRCIHVAGTNGKGSTSAAIAGILGAAGKRTGLFTSPHLMNFTERIIIDGSEISEDETVRLVLSIKDAIRESKNLRGMKPTFFEFVTVMAMVEFRERGVEWAVLETGMGGRLDSTNVVTPEVSVITPVGMDHTQFLGRTPEEIASEKAGVIKPSVPVVLGPQKPVCLKVLEEKAASGGSPLHLYGRDFEAVIGESLADGVRFDFLNRQRGRPSRLSYRGLYSPLAGDYQAVNAAVAVRAAQAAGFDGEASVREGLKGLRLPGRLELAGRHPEIRLDGAHNPDAARALAGALKGHFISQGRRLVLVLGIMADKDVDGIMEPLLPLAWKTVFTAPAYGRAMGPEELLGRARAMFGAMKESFSETAGVAEAVRQAKRLCRPDDLIVITGSFYTAGEAKMALRHEEGRFSRLRETL